MSIENRAIFEEEHNVFRDNFRRFCDEEVAPYTEDWIENGMVDRAVWEKAGEYPYKCISLDLAPSPTNTSVSMESFPPMYRAAPSNT